MHHHPSVTMAMSEQHRHELLVDADRRRLARSTRRGRKLLSRRHGDR